MSGTPPTSPAGTGWGDVVALAERELELVRSGDAAALPGAIATRASLTETLGQAPRPVLEQLATVQQQILVELTLARDGIVRELAALRRGRGAVSGYRTGAGRSAPQVDGAA